jgi:3-hydroxyisobutyrate dehydrogenase
MNKQLNVGFIGTGIMGGGMSHNLLKNGYSLSVYNRTPEKAQWLVDEGATLCDSSAALAASNDVVCICVSNDAVLREVILGEQGILSSSDLPSVIIDHSTVSPSTAKSLAATLLERGVQFIDAPVSGGDVGARNGTLAIMAGGDKQAFDEALPVLECYGKNIVYCGEVGAGQSTKIINQIVVALNVCAMSEGLYLAGELGLNLATTLGVISSGAAGSWSLDNYAPRILKGDLAPGFRAGDMLKDLRIACAETEASGVSLPGLALVTELYEKLAEKSATEFGNHALIELYRS